jgi:hypothetical protein
MELAWVRGEEVTEMKWMLSGGIIAALMMTLRIAAFAQTSAQQASSAVDQEVTVVGCIQREADYRRSRDAGRGGVAGTGVGVGNEFILINASMATPAPTGTAGATAPAENTYELTGKNEGQAEQFIGKRVEISGKVKAAETTSSGRPTGGATAGAPPAGVDVTSKDLKLRELEVTSVRVSTGTSTATCPATP